MHGLIEIHTGPRLSVIFTISENFRKFPPSTKFLENVQPYTQVLFVSSVF